MKRTLELAVTIFVFLVATGSLCLCSSSKSSGAHRKVVTVNLESNWKETPILLETSEFLAEEDPSYFWSFIDAIHDKFSGDSSQEDVVSNLSSGDQYVVAEEFSTHVMGSSSSSRIPLLKFALSLRLYSPTVEMFNQMGLSRLKAEGIFETNDNQSVSFVDVSTNDEKTKIIQTVDALQAWLESLPQTHDHQPQIFKVDHVFPGSERDKQPVAILYGHLGGTNTFHKMHSMLQSAAKEGLVKYVLRHFVSNAKDDFVNLSGYGVELAIKSTEYRAVDDTRVKGEESTMVETSQEDNIRAEVGGFNFSKLKTLHPNLTTKLDDFSVHLVEQFKEVATLKAWELQELSLQLATKLMSTPVDERLPTFQDVVYNFPVHAKSLIHVTVDKELRKEVDKNSHYFMQFMNLGPWDSSLFVNGLFFDLDTVDVFALYQHIRNEVKMVEGLPKVMTDRKSLIEKLTELDKMSPPPSGHRKIRHDVRYHSDKKSVLHFEPKDPSKPWLDVIVIVEPLSRGAQKVIPLLLTLQQVVNMKTRIFLNCIDQHSEMPLKNFFRFVLDPELTFDENGSILRRSAVFNSLPQKPLFTLAMSTPENWLVEAIRSPYDLDNIHLDHLDGKSLWADFKLESILLEGHCFEQMTGNPPRGLQFVLLNGHEVVGDTIVMANLGYFQLKAKPGLWNLALRSGRSSSIYQISSFEGPDATGQSGSYDSLVVTMGTFRSQFRLIKVKVRRPDQGHRDLLSDDDDDDSDGTNSLWESISLWAGAGKSAEMAEDSSNDDRVHIFSLASGHLYERLLRIMMLSVLKNTQSKVKFWFLKNYLSPTFKEFLPLMADEYQFEYELVEYKWPRWLHQQTEKQRIIWGYKILFLDVLFPLNVKRVIYIDADQVVRADVKELNDLDLEGAPYAYTPFCDSRDDMDGFRFWKTGYWASHLHGRKYHISALYVVDLQRFRRVAAGDRLRGQYQGLSQDPNSLSNLDQDLPNNMIHQVPIKSLPQEWLWCETWCDDESKVKAKTIDLCNNPKTKEPKLTAARRIIPEWTSYDQEVKGLMERVKKRQKKAKTDHATHSEL